MAPRRLAKLSPQWFKYQIYTRIILPLRKLPSNYQRDQYFSRRANVERPLLEQARIQYESVYTHNPSPLVSVCIATYNRGALLVERTIPAILNGTYQNIEIVIVGDHCVDDTVERMKAVTDPRVRFIDLPERGNYPQDQRARWMVAGVTPMNKALELARGDWIAHLDDDEVFTPNHIEALLRFAQQGNYELTYGIVMRQMNNDDWVEYYAPSFPTGRRPFTKLGVGHSTVLFRSYLRLFSYDIESWKLSYGAENVLFRRMGRAGVRAGFLNQVVTYAPLRANGSLPHNFRTQEN